EHAREWRAMGCGGDVRQRDGRSVVGSVKMRPAITLRRRSVILLVGLVSVGWIPVLESTKASADGNQAPELRRQIIEAGLTPWNGVRIPLDEGLRGPNRERVSLRQLVGKPILAYNYAEW